MTWTRFLALAGFLAATLATGALGGLATAASVQTWYPTLVKPTWNPPSWVFGPVWTTLYVFMAVAAWRVWRQSDHPGRGRALRWFWAQLALNCAWSFLFFGLRSPGLAFMEIVPLWGAIVATLIQFVRIDRVAAVLWAPYLAWVTFASVLNGTIWWLNR
jgi:tryptophan-rich sensory protein